MVLVGGPDDGVISPWQSRYSMVWYCESGNLAHTINSL